MPQTAAPELLLDVEIESLQLALVRLAEVTGKSLGAVVKQNTRLIAWNLAHNTQPWGMTLAEKKLGEAAVARDVGNVFISAQAMYKRLFDEDEKLAKQWYKLVKGGGYARALRLLQDQSKDAFRNTPVIDQLDPELHQRSRTSSRGRVSRHRPAAIIPEAKQIRQYIKVVQQRVGFAKAGWITAGSQLGNIAKVPAWITRHKGNAPGHADDQSKRKPDPFCVLTNDVDYVSRILKDHHVADALRIQREKMLKHIEHVTTNALKQTGFTAATTTAPSEPLPMAA
ncbi:MAG: hypothetical protein IPK22_11240 [Verrucomicrobiaceae bacterium]|nr:hypothetical protein [Verrucomicrobiaceae bacterium]